MTIKFLTETGSLYEYDSANARIRRLFGKTPPTPRMGVDEEWKPGVLAKDPAVGESAVIRWGDDVAPLIAGMDSALKTTITSTVVEINPSIH